MATRLLRALLLLPAILAGGVADAQTPATPAEPAATTDLATNISRLTDLDYRTRMHAARLIRRAPSPDAVAALKVAVLGSNDKFVRYRALVLLTGFGDRDTPGMMRALIIDTSDRVREVAYGGSSSIPMRDSRRRCSTRSQPNRRSLSGRRSCVRWPRSMLIRRVPTRAARRGGSGARLFPQRGHRSARPAARLLGNSDTDRGHDDRRPVAR